MSSPDPSLLGQIMGNVARSVALTTQVDKMMAGGIRLHPQQLCDIYNQLSQVQQALKQNIQTLSQMQPQTYQGLHGTVTRTVAVDSQKAAGFISMADVVYANALKPDGSFFQNLVAQEANTRAYMYKIWQTNKKYLTTDHETATQITNTTKHLP